MRADWMGWVFFSRWVGRSQLSFGLHVCGGAVAMDAQRSRTRTRTVWFGMVLELVLVLLDMWRAGRGVGK